MRHELTQPYWEELQRYVAAERAKHKVYSAPQDVFAAFKATPLKQVCVVILGQDSDYKPDEVTGLAFALAEGPPIPPSLRNILDDSTWISALPHAAT